MNDYIYVIKNTSTATDIVAYNNKYSTNLCCMFWNNEKSRLNKNYKYVCSKLRISDSFGFRYGYRYKVTVFKVEDELGVIQFDNTYYNYSVELIDRCEVHLDCVEMVNIHLNDEQFDFETTSEYELHDGSCILNDPRIRTDSDKTLIARIVNFMGHDLRMG